MATRRRRSRPCRTSRMAARAARTRSADSAERGCARFTSSGAAELHGPDGAVWIADWYNPICNHNPYRKHHKRGKGNGFITDDRDREHGRIYRVYPAGSTDGSTPKVDSTDDLIAALGNSNLFWRQTAQRILNARTDLRDVEESLINHIEEGSQSKISFAHALHSLGERLDRADPRLQPASLDRRDLQIDAMDMVAWNEA